MQTPEFEESLNKLIQLANQDRIALMCAEAVPWRCHRSLIADALLVRGIRTEDIMTPTRSMVHTLTPFAKVQGTLLTYPAEASQGTQSNPKRERSQSQPETTNHALQQTGAAVAPAASGLPPSRPPRSGRASRAGR